MPLSMGLLPNKATVLSTQFPLIGLPRDRLSTLTVGARTPCRGKTIIRMGGGPRTYPGGVSKWQWKRMQAKKAKQLLQARLSRERQIYEMRKRAELRAAVSELERPWEPISSPPNLFSVSADEQLKVLADRFQKPGGIDLWTERDGPQLFATPDGLPSARFFPKGVVYSARPYSKLSSSMAEGSGPDVGHEEDEQVPNKVRRGGRRDANGSLKNNDSGRSQRNQIKLIGKYDSISGTRDGSRSLDLQEPKTLGHTEVDEMNLSIDL